MRRTIGITVETFMSGGRYQHNVYERGITAKNRRDYEVDNDAIEALKRANEAVWEQMPPGSGPVRLTVKYKSTSRNT